MLNVASGAAFQPMPGMATYAATKAFVHAFSEALHSELAGTGVSVTTLYPGPVPTEFGDRAGFAPEQEMPGFLVVEADAVARQAVDAMVAGRRSVIPGAGNKVTGLLGRYTPRTRPAAGDEVAGRLAHRRVVTSISGMTARRKNTHASLETCAGTLGPSIVAQPPTF